MALRHAAVLGALVATGCAKKPIDLGAPFVERTPTVEDFDGAMMVGACHSVDVDGDGVKDGQFDAVTDSAKLDAMRGLLKNAAQGVSRDDTITAMAFGLREATLENALEDLPTLKRGGRDIPATPGIAADFLEASLPPVIADGARAGQHREVIETHWGNGVKFEAALSPLRHTNGRALDPKKLEGRYVAEMDKVQTGLSVQKAIALADDGITATAFDCTQLFMYAYANHGDLPTDLNALDAITVPDKTEVQVSIKGEVAPDAEDMPKKEAVSGERNVKAATMREQAAAVAALNTIEDSNNAMITEFDTNFGLRGVDEAPNGLIVEFEEAAATATPAPTR